MGGLFGHHHGGGPKPAPAPAAPQTPPQTNGAIAGVSQNYGPKQNVLSNQSQIARGTFLGS